MAEQMLGKGGLVCTKGRELHAFLRPFNPSEAEALGRLPLNRDVSLLLLIRSEQ